MGSLTFVSSPIPASLPLRFNNSQYRSLAGVYYLGGREGAHIGGKGLGSLGMPLGVYMFLHTGL